MAQKYTDPLYDALDADVTAKLGLPSGLLSKIRLNGERSNADQVSEKGARSVYQVIPETRAALIKKYNIDPYESPQAAAMGAGYLLKESLQRNNGDVASAVGEYIGGTDRANWGKATRAYINRVMVAFNQNSGGSGGSGGGGQRLTDVYEQSKPQGAVRPDTIEQKIFESRLAGHSDADIFKKIKEKDPRYKDSKKSGFTDQQIAEKLGLSITAMPVAPKPKDYTGNRMEQFTDQAGAALSKAGRVIAGDGLLDAATAIPRAGIGGVQALMTGLGGMTTEAMAGLYGLGAGAVGAAQGKDFAESATQGIESARATLQPFVPQPVIAPNTANAILGAMAIPMYGTEAAGQANYDAYGNPLSAAAVQGLGDAGFAALGFRGIGKAKPTATPQPAPRPVEPTPQPITEPVGTPAPVSPAAPAANSPDAIRDFVTSRQPEPISPESQTRPIADALGESLRAEGFEQVPIKYDSMVKYTKVDDIGQHDRVYKKDGSLIRDNTVTQYEGGVNEYGEPFTLKIIRDNQNGKVFEIQMIYSDGFVTRLDGGMPISDAKIIQNLESVADVLPNPTPVRPTKIAKKFTLDDKPVAPEPQGKAFTTDNTPVDFVYDVVPIEAIQKSINADLTPNAAARPDLQPRNRDTDASTAQINEISNKLNPNRLLEAPTFDTGAPTIFGAEAVAGHGRLTAIERRYLSGRGADYKAAVIAKARELGIDPAKFEGIENPVLVRRLSDDATAVKVASDSNADTTLKMSVAEQARTDAKSLPDASKLVITEKGEVNIAGSTDFVREFMRSMPTAARGDLMRPDGTLSQAGVRRIQAAIAQKAYNDATMIERINESLDDQGKRISAALVRNAGALVALADDVKAGARVENTLASDLAMAANKYSDIKASGSTVAEYMAQGRLVDDGMTAVALEALQVFGDNARSGKAVSEYIQGKIKEIEDQGNPSQNTLFQTAKEQKEAEAVRRQYEGTPQWMKAPNGKPTKLSEQQWVQVRTPSFKQWFGDWENNPKGASKVVDENGEPLVVYHGSPFGEFNAFTESGLKNVSPKDAKGHYFTSDYGVAQAYGSGQYGGSMRGAQATVYASYLKINNPEYILDNNHRHWYIKQDKKDSLASDGKDGVIYRDSKDTMNDEYIAFDPTQIKSATGNSGAFDGANPNIYMQSNKAASQIIEIEDQGNPSQETLFQRQKSPPDYIRDDSGDPLKLYHYSPKEITEFNPDNGRFGGLFALDDPNDASTYGAFRYEMNVKGELFDNNSFADALALSETKSKKSIKANLKGSASKRMTADDYADVQWLIEDEYRAFDDPPSGDKSRLMQLLGAIDDSDLYAEAQLLRGKVAKDLGASAIRMNDEFGESSILVVNGKNIEFLGNNAPKTQNTLFQSQKPASQVIADTIAKQVLDTGKFDADYAQAAGELAAAYYKATAAALGKTSQEVFDLVGLDVTAGEVKSGANAQISFGDKRHSMVLGDKANASSFVHELGHHFLESHAKLADESPVIRADLDAIMEWGGHKGREYGDLKAAQKTELHERFAETFEQYLLTGKAPTPKLKQVFEKFKTWMESVYDSLISFGETNPRAKLSPDITNVLDNMLGNKADARANAAREAKKSEKADAELLDFKRSAPADGGVSPRQQQSRYNVLRAIGLTEGQIRGGAVTGDSRRMGWDSLLAKSDTEAGRKMKQQMELESDKLREYGDDIVKSTGGTVGAAPEVRGAAILKPLEGYRDWYKAQIKSLYKQADEKAQMTGGIELTDFQKKLRENSFFARDGMRALRKGIASWMREQDLVGADGYFRPMSAKQAEQLRQYINSQYDYSIASGIRTLNDLIDGAVFRVLGENMYADARKMNADYHRIFTEPKGMAALLEADGINRKTSVEKVGARLGALAETDVVQFEQIVKQLESMPTKALQADAKRAIGEIRAQIAEKLTAFDPTRPETPYSISKSYAPFRGGKLNKIFGKETADKLRNYVAASGVLRRVDPNPSGTASAMQNLKMRGAEVAATGVGTAAGGAMGGLTGATIGGVLGQQLGRKLQNRIIEAADQRAFDKAMSPKQFETMRQTMRARANKLERSQPVQDAIKGGDKLSDKAKKVLNARILRSAEWKAYFDNLHDADKAKIKQVGALAWLSSLGADQE